MKKSLVAVGVIVALGVVWTGASWYMGSKIESRLQEETKLANVQLAQLAKNAQFGADVKLEIRDYKKGVFTSNADFAVVISKDASDADQEKKVEEVIFTTDIDHGPFPLSDLAKFNLAPKLAAMNNTLVNNDTTKELFKLTKEKSIFDIHTSLAFDGGVSGEAKLNPIDFTENGDTVKTTPLTVEFSSDKDATNFTTKVKGDQVVVTKEGEETFTIKNIAGSVAGTKVNNDQYLFNEQLLSFAEIAHTSKDKASDFSLKDFSLTTKSDIKDKLFNISQTYYFKSLNVAGFEFGAGKFGYSIDKADPDAMLLLTKVYNNSLLPWNKNHFDSSEMVEQAVRDVLEKGLVFRIDEASLTNKSGASKLAFNLDLNAFNVKVLESQEKSPAELFNYLFKNIDFNVDLSLPMLAEFRNTTQYLDAARYQETALTDEDKKEIEATTAADIEQLKTELQQNINQISQDEKDALPLMLLAQDGNALNMKLNYAADKFTMNGKTYTFDEFMEVTQAPQMLGLAAMLFGMGASSYDYDDSDYSEEGYQEEITEDPAIIEEQEILIPEQPAQAQ
ncbi:YdgA family protein [Proteus sp. DFP240708]|uniref:YdgA family protein n=1 Tax=Proteus TaxID=583 RepID=UPI0018E459B9|nr:MULTISPECIES: YdgA family protein [Proteus]MBI6215565.1 YdgA family protein [Proteus vulgaris]MBI6337325.1 YdgA family protein [Proteus sp. PR00224]MBI6404617.1 YdgA family protein [Proteus sp. PR00208]MBI6544902.1 YdgA family protein [Proteus vulgaris]